MRYTMGVQSTFVERGSPHLMKHHANWRVKAVQDSDLMRETDLMFTGQISLSNSDFLFLRERITEFIKLASERAKDSKAEDVACLNIDWFRVR